jgi:hypothetical protein
MAREIGWLKCILAVVVLSFSTSCGSGADGGGGGGGGDDVPSDIEVAFPATDASISLDFDFSVTGSGSDLIGDIDISGSQGTIAIGGHKLDTIVYANIPWEEAGRNLYQGVAFSDTDLFVYWFYCSAGSNSLYRIYYESTDNYGMAQESASGTCDLKDRASQPSFSLTKRNIGISRLAQGYTITGDDISLSSGQPGTLTYFDTDFTLYPFQDVDCSDCSGGPWWELHSITYDAAGKTACFTILYLYADSDSVFSGYSICFPDLNDINATLSGTWVPP